MASVSDVNKILCTYSDMFEFSAEQLDVACESALSWVKEHLKDEADESNPMIAITAAAIAHYNMFFLKLTESDKYENYKAGDMTVRRNLQKELQNERELRDTAIAAAASILKDERFCFIGN
ncbi:MAG: hypothetical protein U0M02_05625 [Acutalibacteraceae bacterium]|nr:hypothetical protein [Acutalibacteraceae bacterium]